MATYRRKICGLDERIWKDEQVINLFMDYETFGEHQWVDTGIFDFMKALPAEVFKNSDFTFNTPGEIIEKYQPISKIHVPYPISWADEERDLTAWLGNELQDDAFDKLFELEPLVKKCTDKSIKKTGDTSRQAITFTTCVPNGSRTVKSTSISIRTAHHMMHISIT